MSADWALPLEGPPALTVEGDEAALADAVVHRPGATVTWHPRGAVGLARTLGLTDASRRPDVDGARLAVAVDGIELAAGPHRVVRLAVAAVVGGTDPRRLRAWHRRRPLAVRIDGRPWFRGRATSVVIASAEFLGEVDLVPRAHPGDGWIEVQVYALDPGERAAMRRRLPTGAHVPHPRILTARARTVEVRAPRAWPWRADGRPYPRASALTLRCRPAACRLVL